MRRNRKIRKMESWYRRLFERIKENRNRINRGTTEPKILENPFISRAYDKIMRNHRNHVLGMCLSGIIGGTFLFLIWERCAKLFWAYRPGNGWGAVWTRF